MRRLLLVLSLVSAAGISGTAHGPEYSILAVRVAASPGDRVAERVIGARGRNIVFDRGFHRDGWLKEWTIKDYLRSDEAVKLAGVTPEEITDIVISHAHWDHMGGIDLFPKATVWIQKEEFRYYTGEAWQAGGQHGGIDPEDVQELVRLNTEGRIRLVDGDNIEIFPGIHAYTGARHTYASQYLRVDGNPPFVLASDNSYLWRNLQERKASATFSDADHAANIKNQRPMMDLAASIDRVIPRLDTLQFQKFPAQGCIAKIK